jgi:hypothetical protein
MTEFVDLRYDMYVCQLAICSYPRIIIIMSQLLLLFITFMQGKGKAIPLQAWRDPEGSRRLRLPDSKTIGT